MSIIEYFGIGIICTAVFVSIVFLVFTNPINQTGYQACNNPITTNSHHRPAQPTILYHGTTLENALSIHETGLWMIGNSMPYAVWMGDCINIARQYSGTGPNSAIVIVQADSDIKLTDYGNGVYIYKIPGAKPDMECYKINGLKPIAVVDPWGNNAS